MSHRMNENYGGQGSYEKSYEGEKSKQKPKVIDQGGRNDEKRRDSEYDNRYWGKSSQASQGNTRRREDSRYYGNQGGWGGGELKEKSFR